jgi:hypothetical protein
MRLLLSDSTEVEVEVTGQDSAFDAQGVTLNDAKASFSKSMETASVLLKDAIANVKAGLNEVMPDTLEISLGVKFGAEGNLIVSKGSAEANMSFKATWKGNQNG